VSEQGIATDELWTTLEPPEARHADLLPLYAAAAYSAEETIQGRAALQMNRYNDSASEGKLARILSRLAANGSPQVKWRAWLSAGAVGSCLVARLAVDNLALKSGPASERLAQAFCVLCCSEAAVDATLDAEGSDG
jgi:hypothetical protein